jgi:hypothetical protein
MFLRFAHFHLTSLPDNHQLKRGEISPHNDFCDFFKANRLEGDCPVSWSVKNDAK